MIIQLEDKERGDLAIEILPSFFKKRSVQVRAIIKSRKYLSSQMTGYFSLYDSITIIMHKTY